MKIEKYTCDYCGDPYTPTRRGIQRFCSKRCGNKYSYHKNKVAKDVAPKMDLPQKLEDLQNKKMKVEEMSWAGVGNSAGGNLAIELGKGIYKAMQPDESKNATKGDILALASKIDDKLRYELILNEPPNHFGQPAYFDRQTKHKVYLGPIKNVDPVFSIT